MADAQAFQKFVDSLNENHPAEMLRGMMPAAMITEDRVSLMDAARRYALSHYRDDRSPTGFMPVVASYTGLDGRVYDCVPAESQPTLRGLAADRVRTSLNPPPYRGPSTPPSGLKGAAPPRAMPQASYASGTDSTGAPVQCPPDAVPLPRLDVAAMARMPAFEDSFRKPPWLGPSGRKALGIGVGGTAPVAAGLSGRYHSHAWAPATGAGTIYTGAGSWMNVWATSPGANSDFSLSQLWIVQENPVDASGRPAQTLECGWIVSPSRYPPAPGRPLRPVLFIFITADHYDAASSGWNGYFGNLAQNGDATARPYFAMNPKQSHRFSLGGPLDPVSTAGTAGQVGFRIHWQRDEATMNWWLYVGTADQMEPFGCVTPGFFQLQGAPGPLVQSGVGANVVDFGGEEQTSKTIPGTSVAAAAAPIGSGQFSESGFGTAAFQKQVTAVVGGAAVPADIDPHTPQEDQDQGLRMYSIKVGKNDPDWQNYLFFGGPGQA